MKLDNGKEFAQHVAIPKELLSKIKTTTFSERERKLIDVIIEETLGFEAYKDGKESIRIAHKPMSTNYLSQKIREPYTSTYRLINKLVKRSILTNGLTWFRGQLTNDLGINYEFWQWDKKGYSISKKECHNLHEKAKDKVAEWINDTLGASYEAKRGKRKDKADLKVYFCGHHEFNVMVKVKTSWGEEFEVDSLEIPDLPNTAFFFLNRNLTKIKYITSDGFKDLVPKEKILDKPPLINKNVKVPNTNNPKGKPRIKDIALSPSPPVSRATERRQPLLTAKP